jgi:hypothetical protein
MEIIYQGPVHPARPFKKASPRREIFSLKGWECFRVRDMNGRCKALPVSPEYFRGCKFLYN